MEQRQENITLFKVFMSEDAPQRVSNVLTKSYIAQGSDVDEFEEALSQHYEGAAKFLTVNAGTSGLHLSLRLCESPIRTSGYTGRINVLSCPLTCTATNFVIPANGYGIRWVDVDPNTCNMSLEDLKEQVDETTRIIMLVHWGGYVNNLAKVVKIQAYCEEKFGFIPYIIQDCAHSFA